nr:MAG TPA: transmembrane protein [Caudoviricetes sp.]
MKKICGTDIVLALIGVGTILFIRKVFETFVLTGAEPDALVTGFFGFATAEAAICWRIHESKKKRQRKEETAPDEEDLDTNADPNEFDERNEGGKG